MRRFPRCIRAIRCRSRTRSSTAGIPTGAVGLITQPTHAEEILGNKRADVIFLARVLLADPAWPIRAALALGAKPPLPNQYLRASFG
jgi:2,4-dienoyl-CoA reductase-like NADH-dependent reductase (Old Yellow Enzyme family)